ncbi:MAG: single-stranded-DNA-specific exonuclease RecJ, partial [Gammaproteobacteria bacterium]|nr:single-stranded-DNA-specific exonuclease RecJ [Gammaproteobacteria bacterium]
MKKRIESRHSDITLNDGELHPVLQKILANRQVQTLSEIDNSLKQLEPFTSLSGIDDAVAILHLSLIQL